MTKFKIIAVAALMAVSIILEAFLANYKKKIEDQILAQWQLYEQLQTDLNSISAEYSSMVNEPKLRLFAKSRNFVDYNYHFLEIKNDVEK